MQAVIRLGLTGGIGSGKSTVAAMLARAGAVVIDADAISHQTTAAGGTAIQGIQREFGPDFIASDGALDREQEEHRRREEAVRKQLYAENKILQQQLEAQSEALRREHLQRIQTYAKQLVQVQEHIKNGDSASASAYR